MEIGVGRGKKLYDKREDIKLKEDRREMERGLPGEKPGVLKLDGPPDRHMNPIQRLDLQPGDTLIFEQSDSFTSSSHPWGRHGFDGDT